MTIHTLPRTTSVTGAFAKYVIASVVRRINDLNTRIDAQAPVTQHRMGAWEAATSPAAQHAVRVLHAEAAKNTHGKVIEARERVAGMLSENG